MNRKLTYNIFFAQQKDDLNAYELYRKGRETGVIVNKHDIMKILSAVQYSEFEHGTLIFQIDVTIINPYLKKISRPDPRKRWRIE